MPMIHRVYTDVSDHVFYGMLQRAKAEGEFVDEKGMVNIGSVFNMVITAYSNKGYTILPSEKEPLKVKLDISGRNRIHTGISDTVFFNMIEEAKKEGVFVDKEGKVDIGKLLNIIVTTYSDGSFTIITGKKPKVEAKSNLNGYNKE